MRKIKFKRAYFIDANKKEFSHFTEWGVKLKNSEFTSPSTNNFTSSFIDCQFTGLKDKNGVDIYEGDFLKRIGDEHTKEFTGIVEWNYLEFRAEPKNNPDFLSALDYREDYIEVIGNIHENPELLK